MDPRNVLSPQRRLDSASLNVIHTDPAGEWSLAEMIWDGAPCVACRWNGDIHNHKDKGNPRSHGNGTWFVLPDEIGAPIAAMVKAFGIGFDLNTLD